MAALRGQIAIDLEGRIDSHEEGIRTTFETLPDAPISSFTLRIKGGKKSLLVDSMGALAQQAPGDGADARPAGRRADSAPALAVRRRQRR